MTARKIESSIPLLDNEAPSGQYRMIQPRTRPRRVSGEYLDAKDGPIALPSAVARPPRVAPLPAPALKSAPSKSEKSKVIELSKLDDAFDGAFEAADAPDAPDAPDSLVEMMEGLEGTRIKEEAWPRQPMPVVPKPPSVPKMEAIHPPPGPLQPPVSRMTPRPMTEHQIIAEFAKFGPAPTSVWQTPGYAFHVRARKDQLKHELGIHRERRASDVALYEKALRHIDEDAVRRGYIVLGAGLLLGIFVIVIVCMLL